MKKSQIQNENGYRFRTKLKKKQKDFVFSFPFSLIAVNKKLSQSFFGMAPIETLDFNVDAKKLNNLKFVSFDYNLESETSQIDLASNTADEIKENLNPEVYFQKNLN